jgi:hypothetical protein
MRFLIIISIFILGCQDSQWSPKEQSTFNNDCMQAKQSVEECSCLLKCLAEEYLDYNTAINRIASQQASEELMLCVEQCK